MQQVALPDQLDDQLVLPRPVGGARAGRGGLGRPGRGIDVRRVKGGGEQPALGADLGDERRERPVAAAHEISAKAAAAASSVAVRCALSVWASEGNQASNWEAGG